MNERIFITGSPSASYGAWENQLGNSAILIGLLNSIHKYLPNAIISTKYRLSPYFCQLYGIESTPIEPESGRKLQRIFMTILNLFMSLIWRIFRDIFKLNVKILRSTKLLNIYYNADLR